MYASDGQCSFHILESLHPLGPDLLAALWEEYSDALEFSGSATVQFRSPARSGTIRYALDGSEPTAASTPYTRPIRIASDATVRAQLFDARGEKIGYEWMQRFKKLK